MTYQDDQRRAPERPTLRRQPWPRGAGFGLGDPEGGGAQRPARSATMDQFGHVAGERHRNADPSDRQAISPRCRVGDLLVLEREWASSE
jgi:hypothetical protein